MSQKGVEFCSKTAFAGHDRALTHMNSQQLTLNAHDLHKIELAKTSVWTRFTATLPLVRSSIGNERLLGEGESAFSRDEIPESLSSNTKWPGWAK